ncbi:hypothetical protein CNEO_1500033 [Clostridium neonatale]|nr:hypothetical protein CNEO_1500033 [Clostridium neonatale]
MLFLIIYGMAEISYSNMISSILVIIYIFIVASKKVIKG